MWVGPFFMLNSKQLSVLCDFEHPKKVIDGGLPSGASQAVLLQATFPRGTARAAPAIVPVRANRNAFNARCHC